MSKSWKTNSETEQERGYHETLTRITKMWLGKNQYELRSNLRDLENEIELAWRWRRSKSWQRFYGEKKGEWEH